VSLNSDESGKQSLYPDADPDRHQNLIICSMAHCQPSRKISRKSVWKFLHKVANGQQTNGQTDKQWRLHILLGKGNNYIPAVLRFFVNSPPLGEQHAVVFRG